MARNSSSFLKKTSIYLPEQMEDELAAYKIANGGVPTAETIRTAINLLLHPVPTPDYDESEVVRRAILNGGGITTRESEAGRNFDGCWQDPATGKYVYVTGIIVDRGWPKHASASVDETTFMVSEILSPRALARANKALRAAMGVSK